MFKSRFKKHHCTLSYGSDQKLMKGSGAWARLCHQLRKAIQVSQYHPETSERFHSYPAMIAEKQRHLYEGGRCINHPYSILSLYWKTIMTFINLAHMALSTFRLSYIAVPVSELKVHYIDIVIQCLNIMCWVDIALRFNTGYVKGKTTDIVIDRQRICWWYLRTWFIIDLLSSTPLVLIVLLWFPKHPRYVLLGHIMLLLRTTRIYNVILDLKTFMKTFTKSYIWHGCATQAVLFLLTCHWCSCMLYMPPMVNLYWNGYIPHRYNSFLNPTTPEGLLNFSVRERYLKGIFISLSAYFGTGFSMFRATLHDEILIHAFIILFSAMFMVYNFVFLLKIYLTIFSSTIRYNELINQVEEYMRHKQFPLALKIRVRGFYQNRYQEKYFNEEAIFRCLSEGLQNEIKFHTCHKLMEKVALFRGVPAEVMGSILGSLQPEVYLPNESVVRAGEIGNCMYFIASGTVAVYTLKGAEVCHLEDGAYFGEVALLMKDLKRVTSVVAVEITQLYRLDHHEFKQFVMTNDVLYERLEALASQRMHETVILDEAYRREGSFAKEPQLDDSVSSFVLNDDERHKV